MMIVYMVYYGDVVAMRYNTGHAEVLSQTLSNMLSQYRSSHNKKKIGLRLYLTNTDVSEPRFNKKLYKLIRDLNVQFGHGSVQMVSSRGTPVRVSKNLLYGYDDSDILLDFLMNQSVCQWIMFTNGDNMYNTVWFNTITDLMLSREHSDVQLIGWQFVTHHIRADLETRTNQSQVLIKTRLRRAEVDLGSVVITSSAYKTSGARFLPEGVLTTDFYARDWWAIDKVLDIIDNNTLVLPNILLFHQ